MKEIVAEIFKRNFDKVPEKVSPEEEIFLLKVCNALQQSEKTNDTMQGNSAAEKFLNAYADILSSLSKEEQELMKQSLLADAGLTQGTESTISEQQYIHNSLATKNLEDYLPILTSAEDLATIYTEIIAPKAHQAEAKVFELANAQKDMEALNFTMTPEYHAYERFVLNDHVLASNEAQLDAANQEFLANCKKCKEGYYAVIHFEATENVVSELERMYRITDDIIKFMTIRKDEDE